MDKKIIISIIVFVSAALGVLYFRSLNIGVPPQEAVVQGGACTAGANGCSDAQGSATAQNDSRINTISSKELSALLPTKSFFLVNVHIPYEGEIAKTDTFIQYDEIGKNLDKFPKDKSAKVVLYCRSGRMSEIAARELIKLGYTGVSHLSGGIIDWEKSGYEIIKNNYVK